MQHDFFNVRGSLQVMSKTAEPVKLFFYYLLWFGKEFSLTLTLMTLGGYVTGEIHGTQSPSLWHLHCGTS